MNCVGSRKTNANQGKYIHPSRKNLFGGWQVCKPWLVEYVSVFKYTSKSSWKLHDRNSSNVHCIDCDICDVLKYITARSLKIVLMLSELSIPNFTCEIV